jgi:DASS family divalent anion:Na+ symporter
MMPEELQAGFSWMKWFAGTWLWLIIMIALCFIAIMALYRPAGEKGKKAEGQGLAKQQLEALGPMTKHEKISAVLLVVGLLGWMTTKITGIDATLVALIVLLLLFITGVLEAGDFKNRIAWSSVVFIGCIYSLASLISKMGWSSYLAKVLAPVLSPIVSNIWILIPVLCIVVYIMRIVVISQTAAITIVYAIFGGICMEYGIHPWPILFTGYVATLVWHYAANNVTYATALAATNDEMVSFGDTFQMNVVYMIVNLIACTASIPVWMLLGYC